MEYQGRRSRGGSHSVARDHLNWYDRKISSYTHPRCHVLRHGLSLSLRDQWFYREDVRAKDLNSCAEKYTLWSRTEGLEERQENCFILVSMNLLCTGSIHIYNRDTYIYAFSSTLPIIYMYNVLIFGVFTLD